MADRHGDEGAAPVCPLVTEPGRCQGRGHARTCSVPSPNLSRSSHSWLREEPAADTAVCRTCSSSPFRHSSSADPPRISRAEGSGQLCGFGELRDKWGASIPQRQRTRPWRSRAPLAWRHAGVRPHATRSHFNAWSKARARREGAGGGWRTWRPPGPVSSSTRTSIDRALNQFVSDPD